nr:unnamed protein product [Digitaria exilis]
MDKGHKRCLILWLRIQDWANLIINFNSRESSAVFSCGHCGNWNRKAKQLSSKALRPMMKA